ncbi:permease protein of ABC transporter [[Synechococcus] sp. NIES-970]|uniref:ABC transporter permease n=1 Tax=Picosynechococcus sp. NKBG15041c TaxID=1407650 RepID=UPI000463BC33|nr:ABC transporter permease [Picosynechococcus sp. NKBG15041c]BAW97295.1 permease protein of ABC transporter [[Synechococcus] sp. NIES-970]
MQNNSRGWRRFRQNRLAVLGAIVLGAIALLIFVFPLIYTTPIDGIDFVSSAAPPSWQHPFGTDDLGQDQLARVLFGGKISLAVGLAAMVVAIIFGTIIGAIAGFYGGWLDQLLMRITDLFLSLPQLPLLLLIVYLFREKMRAIAGAQWGTFSLVVVVIGGLNWMAIARLVRAQCLSLKTREFITAARAMGANPLRILTAHILPNLISLIAVAATLSVSNAIITESTLSFLGLGFPPDIPTWGRMLYDAQNFVTTAPHMALFPGLAIFLTVLSLNYLGDGLRDASDPKSNSH